MTRRPDETTEQYHARLAAKPTASPTEAGMTQKLLPCPFCGGEAGECHVAEPTVQCLTCPVGVVGETEAEAVATWNTRAALTAAPKATETPGLREATHAVIAAAGTTYRKRNGQIGTLEGDDGEMMVLVPSDEFEHLRAALSATPQPVAVPAPRSGQACMCRNVPIGSHKVSVLMDLPEHMAAQREARISAGLSPQITVDACLVEEVRDLWDKGVVTTGCCCGHNTLPGFIGVDEASIALMISLGYEVFPNNVRPEARDSFYPKSTIQPVAVPDDGAGWDDVVAWRYRKGARNFVNEHDQPWKAESGWEITPLVPASALSAERAEVARLRKALEKTEDQLRGQAKALNAYGVSSRKDGDWTSIMELQASHFVTIADHIAAARSSREEGK